LAGLANINTFYFHQFRTGCVSCSVCDVRARAHGRHNIKIYGASARRFGRYLTGREFSSPSASLAENESKRADKCINHEVIFRARSHHRRTHPSSSLNWNNVRKQPNPFKFVDRCVEGREAERKFATEPFFVSQFHIESCWVYGITDFFLLLGVIKFAGTSRLGQGREREKAFAETINRTKSRFIRLQARTKLF
jgi:hypothetical protein